MFTSYKKHSNKLYNKLVELSRNKFFYNELKLNDNFETRVLLIFFHFIIILRLKKNEKYKKIFQESFDNIFQNIEINIRELGYGDTKVNNTMKNLNKIFYDILYNVDQHLHNNEMLKKLLVKYFFPKDKLDDEKAVKLADYFKKFRDFCFDLDVNNMLNGSINFNYR